MSYIAPLKDMLFNIEHLARIDQIAQIPGFEDAGLETAQAVLEECAKLNQDVISPLNWEGDKNPSFQNGSGVTTTPGFKEALPAVRPRRLARPAAPRRLWRSRPAQNHCRSLRRNAQLRQHGFCAVPLAHRRCDRSFADRRFGRTQSHLFGKADLRPVDRHHEPDRATSRIRPGRCAHPRRASARWHLQNLRHQDLHHLR